MRSEPGLQGRLGHFRNVDEDGGWSSELPSGCDSYNSVDCIARDNKIFPFVQSSKNPKSLPEDAPVG